MNAAAPLQAVYHLFDDHRVQKYRSKKFERTQVIANSN